MTKTMSELSYVTDRMFRPDVVAVVDGAEVLVGGECEQCGDVRFPRALACPVCNAAAESIHPRSLGSEGVIVAASRVDRAIPPFVPPFMLAYVEIGGARALGQVETDEGEPAVLIGRSCRVITGENYRVNEESVHSFRFEVNK
ncbi:MAG: DNA-binding protein [Subtercola sp.]|nr:DNA-binding protein [Subtercola sp.]